MEKSLATVFKSYPNPSIIFERASLKIVEANEATSDYFHYSEEELNSLSLFDLFPETERQKVMDQIDQFKEMNGYAGSWIQVNKFGQEFEAEIYLQTLEFEGETRRIAHLYKVQSLEKDELTYHLSNSPLGFAYWNEEFRLERFSELLEKWTDYSFEEMHGRHARDIADQIVPDEEQDIAIKRIKELDEKKASKSSFEIKLLTKEGNIIHTHWYNSAEFDEEGNLKSVASMVENVSAAKERQNKLQLAMGGGDVGFWHYYPDTETIEIDQDWMQNTLGYIFDSNLYSLDEFWKMIHPDDRPEVRRKMENLIDQRSESLEVEFRIRDHDGRWRWILSRAQLTDFIERGRPTRVTGINVDIDERKRTELQHQRRYEEQELLKDVAFAANENRETSEALRECLNRICSYLNWEVGHYYELTAPDSQYYRSSNIWCWDEEDNFALFRKDSDKISFNRGEGFIGIAAKKGTPVWYEAEKETDPYLRKPSADLCGISTGIILPVKVQGRVISLLEFYTTRVEEPSQQIKETLKTATSQVARLIERQLYEQQLNEERESYRLIAENSTDIISRHSPDGTYTYVSPACRDILGFEPEELVGTNPYNTIHPDDRERVQKNHKKVLNQQGLTTIAYRKETKSGDYIWVESTVKSIWENDELKELLVSTRDISDRE